MCETETETQREKAGVTQPFGCGIESGVGGEGQVWGLRG